MPRLDEIRSNLATVERRIAGACAAAGRPRSDVTLIAVSKTFPASDVDAAVAAGITDVGENRVQEARSKIEQTTSKPRWHLIGHLQSNKAKDAARLFDVVHTVDSIGLAEKLARAAEAAGKRQQILIEVNIGRESQKSGVLPDDVERLAKAIAAFSSLSLQVLMAIPPIGAGREHFRELRSLRDKLSLPHLSMGMSDDFEAAIEEGSTMIRIGRAIFGSREVQ